MRYINKAMFLLMFIISLSVYGCGELLPKLGSDNSTQGGQSGGDNPNLGGGTSTGGDSGGTTGGGTTGGGDSGGAASNPIKAILAGTGSGKGIYYSIDNGTTWTQAKAASSNGANLAGATWQSFGDLGNGVVLAGSGDIVNQGHEAEGLGIIKSTDGGKTWTKTNAVKGQFTSFIDMGGNLILAGAKASESGISGIWRSTDGGDTWKRDVGAFTGTPRQYDFFNTKGDNLLISTQIFSILKVNDNMILTHGENYNNKDNPDTIIMSFDKGATWLRGLEPSSVPVAYAFLKHSEDMVVSVAASGTSGIVRSSDGGFTWGCASKNFNDGRGASFLSLVELKSGTILAGNSSDQDNKDSTGAAYPSGIWRSPKQPQGQTGACDTYNNNTNVYDTDGKTLINQKHLINKFTWQTFEALDNGDALAGCSYHDNTLGDHCTGVYKSTDDGITWKRIDNMLKGLDIYSIKAIR